MNLSYPQPTDLHQVGDSLQTKLEEGNPVLPAWLQGLPMQHLKLTLTQILLEPDLLRLGIKMEI
jgi:hypothetical protein